MRHGVAQRVGKAVPVGKVAAIRVCEAQPAVGFQAHIDGVRGCRRGRIVGLRWKYAIVGAGIGRDHLGRGGGTLVSTANPSAPCVDM